MWRRLRPYLAGLDPVRVENPIHPGTPDLNLATGAWIELKAMSAWPRRAAAVLRIPHYTPQQRVWLYRRWHFGGSSWLLLHVREGDAWLLFAGDVAARLVGRASRRELELAARGTLIGRNLGKLPALLIRDNVGGVVRAA